MKIHKIFEAKIKTKNKVVILSPHLDDSVLSCGNLIEELVKDGINVVVVNFFTKGSEISSNLTKKLLSQSNNESAESYFMQRKEEDKKALKILGVEDIHNLDFIDGAWRGKDGAYYPDSTLNQFHLSDQDLAEEVKLSIEKLQISGTQVFAPLARGRHVDHIIVRKAARDLFGDAVYYSDLPYAGNYEQETSFIIDNHLEEIIIESRGFQKAKAVNEYATQKKSFVGYHAMDTASEFYFHKP